MVHNVKIYQIVTVIQAYLRTQADRKDRDRREPGSEGLRLRPDRNCGDRSRGARAPIRESHGRRFQGGRVEEFLRL